MIPKFKPGDLIRTSHEGFEHYNNSLVVRVIDVNSAVMLKAYELLKDEKLERASVHVIDDLFFKADEPV